MMTTHPEDAMTRERALEEALKPFADYYNGDNRDDSRLLLPLHYYRNAALTLASAQQEPPSADDGVTDEMVIAACEAYRDVEGSYPELEHMIVALEAAARAKSGEKGGA